MLGPKNTRTVRIWGLLLSQRTSTRCVEFVGRWQRPCLAHQCNSVKYRKFPDFGYVWPLHLSGVKKRPQTQYEVKDDRALFLFIILPLPIETR